MSETSQQRQSLAIRQRLQAEKTFRFIKLMNATPTYRPLADKFPTARISVTKLTFCALLCNFHRCLDCNSNEIEAIISYKQKPTLFWTSSDLSLPFLSVTFELPGLAYRVAADRDVVTRSSQPRIVRRNYIAAAFS